MVWYDAISAICFGNFNFPAIALKPLSVISAKKFGYLFSEILGFQKMSNGGKIQISNFKNGLHKILVRSRIIKLIGLVFFQFTKRSEFLPVHFSISSTITCSPRLWLDKIPNLFNSCGVKIDDAEHNESLVLNYELIIGSVFTF